MRQRHGTITEVTVGDGAGSMTLVFFNHKHARLKQGAWGLFAGTVGSYQGKLQFTHPDCHMLDNDSGDDDWARALVPIYPASKDVSSWVIQKSVKLLVGAGGGFGELVVDPLPGGHPHPARPALPRRRAPGHPPPHDHGRRRAGRPPAQVGRGADPPAHPGRPPSRRRARTGHRPSAAQPAGCSTRSTPPCPSPSPRASGGGGGAGRGARPRPADAPAAAGRGRLGQDRRRPPRDGPGRRRRRAGRAARPHRGARRPARPRDPRRCSARWAGPASSTATPPAPASPCSPGRSRRRRSGRPAPRSPTGRAGIVVGTHALLQEGVDFADLGLVVVDEQHRFGVEQRDALRAKGSRPPHVLVMTATPIPRTVAMTVYGDLEISTLRQLPSGRGGVASSVVPVQEKPRLARPRVGAAPRGGRRRPPGLRRLPADR